MNKILRYKRFVFDLLIIITLNFVSSEILGQDLNGSFNSIIPKPVTVNPTGKWFIMDENTDIYVDPLNSETTFIGGYLLDIIKPSTGYNIFVMPASGEPEDGNIYITITNGDPSLGEEGYELTVTEDLMKLQAYKPAGLFRGIQSLRQLFSPLIESKTVQQGKWRVSTGIVRDYPRFEWRGVMLDVARHFFEVEEVKRYIDLAAYYKINRFHLHLADDQGWRILINSWPNLAVYGGSTSVNGESPGYYTQSEYSEIVKYANKRYITVIPEIDMPGHTNAALASYRELNPDGIAPPLYTGIEVGFSAFDVHKEVTYKFIDDIIRELSSITPDPYIHIGGDEAPRVDSINYVYFVDKVQNIVQSYNKKMVGWEEISKANLYSTSIAQLWTDYIILSTLKKGVKVIMSPASRTYLDMKYDSTTKLGLNWAGFVEVKDGYDWDPANFVEGINEDNIIGVEAPLWSETLLDIDDIEYMAFPRLPGHAEIGWSAVNGRNWEEYKERLAEHGLRWKEMGINYYWSPQVPWKDF